MLEKDFQLKVEKFLNDEGIYFVKYWGGGNFTRSGVPDLLCCIGGRFVGVELKKDNGKVSELQQYNIDKIIQSGGVALVLRPSDFDRFRLIVQKLKLDFSDYSLKSSLKIIKMLHHQERIP